MIARKNHSLLYLSDTKEWKKIDIMVVGTSVISKFDDKGESIHT